MGVRRGIGQPRRAQSASPHEVDVALRDWIDETLRRDFSSDSVSVQDDSTLHAIPAVSIIPGTLHKGDNIQIIDIFNADHSEKIGISVSSLDEELLAKAELQPDRRSVRVVSKDWLDASLESSSRFNRSGSGSAGMNDFIFEVKK